MNFILIAIGLILLILGGNWLLKAAVSLSIKLNIPKIVIGMTVISFATSAPELITSINAALTGASGLAVGNVIGSNIANIGLVLGITVLLSPIKIQRNFYLTDWPVMMITSLILYVFISFDKLLELYEGFILFLLLIFFLIYLLKFQKQTIEDKILEDDKALVSYKVILFLVAGGIALWSGSELLIKGAKALAVSFGVSNAIIGVTVLAVGTSIPELAASIIAILKKEKTISLGNLIGSNIFNILAVLGITSMITPLQVKQEDLSLLTNDIYWMLGVSFIILPLIFLSKKRLLNWKSGLIFLVTYFIFLYVTVLD